MKPLGSGAPLAEGLDVRASRARDRAARAARLREGRLLGHLTHPRLMRAYEVHEGLRPLVVLVTLRGATLEALIADRPLSTAETADLGLQVGSALRYINGEGL